MAGNYRRLNTGEDRNVTTSALAVLYVKAIGLMAGVGLSVSLDLETNSLFYKIKVGA